eukprot:Amastigsp_a342313_721.p4 type:complete len:116 gc:universal Amastigsp_a342313_721:385-732(+)
MLVHNLAAREFGVEEMRNDKLGFGDGGKEVLLDAERVHAVIGGLFVVEVLRHSLERLESARADALNLVVVVVVLFDLLLDLFLPCARGSLRLLARQVFSHGNCAGNWSVSPCTLR